MGECMDEREEKPDILRAKIVLLEMIIDRYHKVIEESETKTVSEMKEMVDPDRPGIRELIRDIKESFTDYDQKRDLLSAVNLLLDRLRGIVIVEPPVQFWADPEEVLRKGVGDRMDLAIISCSVMIGLGCSSARVLVLEDGTPHVMFVYDGRHQMIDLVNMIVKPLDPNLKKRYSFNDREFTNYQEEV